MDMYRSRSIFHDVTCADLAVQWEFECTSLRLCSRGTPTLVELQKLEACKVTCEKGLHSHPMPIPALARRDPAGTLAHASSSKSGDAAKCVVGS
eukprot:scaffold101719_cov33-Tisochrysis_lutea.AAC.2